MKYIGVYCSDIGFLGLFSTVKKAAECLDGEVEESEIDLSHGEWYIDDYCVFVVDTDKVDKWVAYKEEDE